ncbi:hypothetical protein K1J07_08515 [Streptococcus gordonii]|uniref:hypothetical protein n=1 Tax=Streptococcus gordonii TaxID=1302 RepID=UPI000778F621|nr:hypothetical protein [Streptococcus gordonii]MBZ2148719.1 hypothetical protein [Streptococcus gordonii]VTT10501.1 Uncharacterized protein conserved in bacteria [Streptococcus gordonii]
MLTRINLIRQLGRFQHIVPENLPENGNLKKINLIYAPNGSGKTSLRDITMKIRPFLERIFKIKYPDFYVEGQTWLKNYLDFIKNSNSDKKYQDFQKLYPYLNDLKDILAYTRPFNHDDAKDSFSKLRFKQTKQMVEKTLRLFHVI